MTLSSTSRQHRKSMLPTPRLSSRLSSRRITSGETSRIARRVPSPMLAPPASLINTSSAMRSCVPHPPPSHCLPLPEFNTRRAFSPSLIPSPSMQPSVLKPEHIETLSDSPARSSRTEGGSTEVPYPTPPASVETKHERLVGQEGRAKVESLVQHQRTSSRGPPPPARHPSRPRDSTALTSFSRTENSTTGDATGTSHHVAPKNLKLARNSGSGNGKENRRPPARTRVLVPTAPTVGVVVPPRPIQRTTVTDIPSSEASPLPLVINKKLRQTLMANHAGQDLQAKSTAEPVAPAGIKALIGDLDHFSKEWTGMFDDLHASAGRHGDVVSDASARMHPIMESENPRTPDDLEEQIRKSDLSGGFTGGTRPASDSDQIGEITAPSLAPSVSANSISTISASSTDGENVHFDVSAASLVRWQHRDNTMLKNAPTVVDMMPELRTVVSPVRRSAPHSITPRTPRLLPPLPEINQSPIISGFEMTSAVLSSRKDGITKFLETPPTPTETTRRSVSSRPSPLSSSPSPITMSLVSVSIPHTSSPLAHQHQRPHDSPPQRTAMYASGDAGPRRSTSMRGLRAIFKRTSAGLTNVQRQRAGSLKELIGEPRVLSLGSISISNLRDAGIPGGDVVPTGPMDDADISGDMAPKRAVRW